LCVSPLLRRFNTYSVSFIRSLGFSADAASAASSIFPLGGAVSTVPTGLALM
jgi:hypothetical protein